MKVLLVKDVYKLGRAGDVKRVADGFGRNFLIPQGLAVLATPSALMQAKHIRAQADTKRAVLNEEMSSLAEILSKLTITFSAKAGETGKLYGSITPAMITDAIKEKTGLDINRRQIDFEPLRTLGTHKVNVRLTIDLIPAITVIVYREGETIEIPASPQEADLEAEPVDEKVGEKVDEEVEEEAEAT
jgi:large subunit ribosomal protein L9